MGQGAQYFWPESRADRDGVLRRSQTGSVRVRYQAPCPAEERNARSNPAIDFSIRSNGIVSDKRM